MTAKKDKKLRRIARKRKMQRRTEPSGQQILLKRVQSSERLRNVEIIQNPDEIEKMSEVILRFAEPLQDEYGDVHPNMIRFAILVWNASILPKETQAKAIKDIAEIIQDFDREARQEMLLAISMLLERKAKHFSENRRFILDYQIKESAHGMNLDVVSSLPEGYSSGQETNR